MPADILVTIKYSISLTLPESWKQLYAHAQSGNVGIVNQLLSITPVVPLCYVVEGYAVGGFAAEVRKFNCNGFFSYQAAFGYAFGGHVTFVNEEVAKGASHQAVLEGYAKGGHLVDQQKVLELLAQTHNSQLRRKLADEIRGQLHIPDLDQQVTRAGVLNTMMRAYELNYAEAQLMLREDARIWLTQGWQAFDGKMPFHVYMSIAAALLHCTTVTALKLFVAMNKEVYARATNRVLTQFKGGLFNIDECAERNARLTANYKTRMRQIDEHHGYSRKRQRQ